MSLLRNLWDRLHRLALPRRWYTYSFCGETYRKGWTDADARHERHENGWGAMPDSEMTVVCDDCYRMLMMGHPP